MFKFLKPKTHEIVQDRINAVTPQGEQRVHKLIEESGASKWFKQLAHTAFDTGIDVQLSPNSLSIEDGEHRHTEVW